MKLIIAGSRNLEVTTGFIYEIIDKFQINPSEIVSGGARGIDRCGENFLHFWNQNFKDPSAMVSSYKSQQKSLKVFEADWETHGKAAGPIRNKEMAEYGDALLLIWDGESRGSANMKEQMQKLNKPIYEVVVKKNGS